MTIRETFIVTALAQAKSKILRNDLTDPLLTHWGKNEGFSGM